MQENHIGKMDVQHLTMHSMPPFAAYIQYFCMYIQLSTCMKNFKENSMFE
jgi:hypothetical protein